jgi:hypothetical protein
VAQGDCLKRASSTGLEDEEPAKRHHVDDAMDCEGADVAALAEAATVTAAVLAGGQPVGPQQLVPAHLLAICPVLAPGIQKVTAAKLEKLQHLDPAQRLLARQKLLLERRGMLPHEEIRLHQSALELAALDALDGGGTAAGGGRAITRTLSSSTCVTIN